MAKRMAVVSTGSWGNNYALDLKKAAILVSALEESDRVTIEYIGGTTYGVIKKETEGPSIRVMEILTAEEFEELKQSRKQAEE